MQVEVLLFAAAVDAAQGHDRVVIDLPCGGTAGDVLDRVAAISPNLAAIAKRSRLAVNQHYVSRDTVIDSCCEIALIPPVSGG